MSSRARRLCIAALVAAAATVPTAPDSLASAPGAQDAAGAAEPDPSFRDLLSLQRVVSARVAPDGNHIAYLVATPDWESNGARLDLWLAPRDGAPAPLAEASDIGNDYRWLPDSSAVAFLRRDEADAFIHTVGLSGERGTPVGPLPRRVSRFAYSPTGTRVALLLRESQSERDAEIQQRYGPFDIKDEGWRVTAAWLLDLEARAPEPVRVTGPEIHVTGLRWSPEGKHIAIEHQPDPRANSGYDGDISILSLDTRTLRPLATGAGVDGAPVWSPDGERVAYLSARGAGISNLPLELMVVPAHGGAPRLLTGEVATEPRSVEWTAAGISFLAEERALVGMYRIDPEGGSPTRVGELPEIVRGTSTSADGSTTALVAETRDTLPEVYRLEAGTGTAQRLTQLTDQVADWSLGTRELIRWEAADGTPIEGVLTKPDDFDPAQRYPLLIVVHGGPRAASRPSLAPSFVYPIVQWVARGALVLQPNYRGSTGYGPAFRTKHHRTLGSGDARDVEAGAQYLIREGLADPARIGLMGWSYGGFISAYLSATSAVFAAISVGAGISDWRSHYAWEPANVTTRDFSFGATPWADPSAYEVASPVAHIRSAGTPTLIQHVDGDPIVPVISAYELYQALQDVGVETRFIEYHGPGHGVSGLRQLHGAQWHNWQWFARHLWSETVELPTPPR